MMFHSRAGRDSSSNSSSTRSSFHTANDSFETEDEIKTIIASSSSEASEIPSLVLGQRSFSSGRVASSDRSEEDYESHYLTAKSSFDSRYRSDTFFTATSHSGRSPQDHSSSFYSTEFESDESASLTHSSRECEFENDQDAEIHFLKAKLKSIRNGKQETHTVEPESDRELEGEKSKFVEIQLASLQQRKIEALTKHRKKIRDKTKKNKNSEPLIPCGMVERLRIQNLLHTMKTVSQAPDHEIDQCESCRKVKEAVVEKEFMREKHRHVYNQLTEERYRQHIVTHDPLSEIGNLASTLPKLSSDPVKIWNKLMQNGIT